MHGYIGELFTRLGLIVSSGVLERWFLTIGPFKGTTRLTSKFPSGLDNWATYRLLKQYLKLVVEVEDR